jgi:transketolase
MRKTFVKTLIEEAKKDKNIFLITGDLGFMALEEFRDALPKQYLNAGVSEQNMIAMAAGMALTGKKVYAYSIVPFATMRPFEHIRNDICYQNLNVTIVGVGAGFSYSFYGLSHNGLEDISVMRSLANMTVVCPGDPLEVAAATRESVKHKGPMYLRLGKAGEPNVHQSEPIKFQIGRAIEVLKGKDATIIATSNMLENAVEAGKLLQAQNIKCRVVSMHTIKPIDKAAILRAAKETKAVVTLEEHSIIGGLGSAVAEVLAEQSSGVKFIRLGVPDVYPHILGSQNFLREQFGLAPKQIVQTIKHAIGKRN